MNVQFVACVLKLLKHTQFLQIYSCQLGESFIGIQSFKIFTLNYLPL